jgi:hypothetical protein
MQAVLNSGPSHGCSPTEMPSVSTPGNITDTSCASSPVSTPATPRAAVSPDKRSRLNIFRSKDDWLQYLRDLAKSAKAMQLLEAGQYSKKALVAVTQVTVSKLVELHGLNPATSQAASIHLVVRVVKHGPNRLF